jgi:hypothetical protein
VQGPPEGDRVCHREIGAVGAVGRDHDRAFVVGFQDGGLLAVGRDGPSTIVADVSADGKSMSPGTG